MPKKETHVSLSTLMNQPNPYGEVAAGSLADAVNICMRRVGTLEPLEDFEEMQENPGALTHKSLPFGETNMFVYANGTTGGGRFVNESAISSFLNVQCGEYVDGLPCGDLGKTFITSTRERQIFTHSRTPIVWDGADVTQNPRPAGLPVVNYCLGLAGTSPAGNVLEDQNWTAYRAHFLRDHEDGYIQVGSPSPPIASQNILLGAAVNPQVHVIWSAEWPVRPGDWLVVSRVKQQMSRDALGDEFRECFRFQLTATETIGRQYVFIDTTADEGLGAFLYVNEFQQGATLTNYMPPPSRDVHTYRGVTWYASTSYFWNLQVTIKNTFGDLVTPEERANGIGTRLATGTVTNGSTAITLVSAADIVGLVPGQSISAGFPANTVIVSITGGGPYTINVNNAFGGATAPGTVVTVVDVFMGVRIPSATGFLQIVAFSAAFGTLTGTVIIPDRTIAEGAELGFAFQVIKPVNKATIIGGNVTATNGQNYSPSLAGAGVPLVRDQRKNRLYFSKPQQPEAVPPVNYLDVGAGEILRILSTQSALYVYCTDGIYRITGDGDDWRVDPFDTTTYLIYPNALDAIGNTQYFWANRGICALSDAGVQSLTDNRIDIDLRAKWKAFTESDPAQVAEIACNQYTREVWLNIWEFTGTANAVWAYVYNEQTAALTAANFNIHSLGYDSNTKKLIADHALTDPGFLTSSLTEKSQVTMAFNPFQADESSDLKQWMEVTLYLEGDGTLPAHVFSAAFTGVGSPVVVNCTTDFQSGYFTKIIPIPKQRSENKQINLALGDMPTTAPWKIFGLSIRYRTASEKLHK